MNRAFLMRLILVSSLPLMMTTWAIAAQAEPSILLDSIPSELEKLDDEESLVQLPLSPLGREVSGFRQELIPAAEANESSSQPDSVLDSGGYVTTAEGLLGGNGDAMVPNIESPIAQANPDPAAEEEVPASEADPVDVQFTGDTLRLTITGTRNALPVDRLPATVTVFELEDFQFYQVNSLQELLRYEPGVSVRDNNRYGAQDVNIRGIEGNRILFQVDGVRLPERFLFGPFNIGRGEYVDFSALQAIEVLRGPASTLYGSDALGGVITYRSLRPTDLLGPDDTFAGNISTTYRSATGGLDNVVRAALRDGPIAGVLVLSRQDGRELSNFGPAQFTDSIDRGNTNLYGSIVYDLDDTSRLTFTAEDVNQRTNYVVAPGNLLTGAPATANLRHTGENRIDRTRVSVAYEFENAEGESFLQFARAQLFYQVSNTTEIDQQFRASGVGGGFAGSPVRRDSNNQFIANSYGGDLQLRSDFSTGNLDHRLTYGLDISRTFNSRLRDRTQTNLLTGAVSNTFGPGDTFPIKDFADGNTLRLGAYLQDEIAIGPFSIIAGLRFDHYDLQTTDDDAFNGQPVSLTASAVSPRIAVRYEATPEISFYGQYARGFRAPLYSEITSGFTNLAGAFFKYETISSPNLQPESSDSFEIGVRGNFPQLDFRLTGFYNTYNNFIATAQQVGTRCLIAAPVCPPNQVVNQFQAINIGRARIYGVEFGGEYRFSPGPEGFSLLASLAWTQGDDIETNRPLTTIDPFTAVAGIRYRAPGDQWRAELISTFAGRARVPEGTTTFVPDAYAVVDFIGSYNLTSNLGLSLGVYNLLNRQYYNYSEVRGRENVPAISQFSQAGTNVRLGVNFTF